MQLPTDFIQEQLQKIPPEIRKYLNVIMAAGWLLMGLIVSMGYTVPTQAIGGWGFLSFYLGIQSSNNINEPEVIVEPVPFVEEPVEPFEIEEE